MSRSSANVIKVRPTHPFDKSRRIVSIPPRIGKSTFLTPVPADKKDRRMPGTERKVSKPKSRMRQLYARCLQAQLDPKYIQSVALPDWWDDKIADTDAGYGRALGLISSHLNIDLRALWDERAPLRCPDFGKTNFKKRSGSTEDDVQWPKCVALSAAKIVLQIIDRDFTKLPTEGRAVRDIILGQGKNWVDLPNLLEFLWAHGIPVLHVSNFPKGSKKMAALAARIDGRPVIVLAKNHSYSSLVVFDLAHELGHILCRHLDTDKVLIDSVINRTEEESDPEERAANRVAVEVLTGKADLLYVHGRTNVTANALARMALATGQKDGVEPAVIAQNFGHGRQFFPLANAASGLLGDKNAPVALVRKKMLEHLRLDQLADEDAEFLLRVTGCGVGDALPVGQ
jgi:hypothetical protein